MVVAVAVDETDIALVDDRSWSCPVEEKLVREQQK